MIPLFVTALLVPFLAVILQVVRADQKPHHRLGPKEATKYVFAAMWTPVIMLLLGGFTIAAALSKFHIAKMMATFFLSKAGTRPRTVLIMNMFVAMILSMWISNVASPVLCFSIIQVRVRMSFSLKKSSNVQDSHFFATCPPIPTFLKLSSLVLLLHLILAVLLPPSLRHRTSSRFRTCDLNQAGEYGSSLRFPSALFPSFLSGCFFSLLSNPAKGPPSSRYGL